MQEVAANLNKDRLTNIEQTLMKRDIYNVSLIMMRKAEPVKLNYEKDIISDKTELLMPGDFFVALDVIFFGVDNLRYDSVEIDNEQYNRWQPNVELITTSFAELVTSATPQKWMSTPENEKLDGKLGYCYFDDIDQPTLKWKPGVDGRVLIYYVSMPIDEEFLQLENTPDFHFTFYKVLIDGLTLKWLMRQLNVRGMSEVDLIALRTSISEYKTEFQQGIIELAGYSNRQVETGRVDPSNFLNDSDMIMVSWK